MSEALSINAHWTLEECEAEMRQCRDGMRRDFRRFGALLEWVRETKLYLKRDPSLTFDAYCQREWDFTADRAYQIISASKAVEISPTMVGEISTVTNERQARNLIHSQRPQPREFLDNPATWTSPYKYTPESELTPEQVERRDEYRKEIRINRTDENHRQLEAYRQEAIDVGLTPQQEAAADFGAGWHKNLHKHWVFYNSLRDHGGIAKLARRWSKEVKQNNLTELCAVRDCINECIEYFEKELGK